MVCCTGCCNGSETRHPAVIPQARADSGKQRMKASEKKGAILLRLVLIQTAGLQGKEYQGRHLQSVESMVHKGGSSGYCTCFLYILKRQLHQRPFRHQKKSRFLAANEGQISRRFRPKKALILASSAAPEKRPLNALVFCTWFCVSLPGSLSINAERHRGTLSKH
jgi:hypothetical protein